MYVNHNVNASTWGDSFVYIGDNIYIVILSYPRCKDIYMVIHRYMGVNVNHHVNYPSSDP